MTGPDSRFKLKTVFLSGLLLFFIFSFTPFLYAAGKVSIKNIKHQSFKGYTRVTIYLSGPVEFSMKHLSNPERLYFDLKDTTLPPKTKANLTVGDAILKTIRTKQFNKDTVRVVFDLGKAEDFKASLLNKKNPRLVIDIYAVKSDRKEPDVARPEPTAEKGRSAPGEKPDAVTSAPAKPESPAKKTEPDIVPPAPVKPEAPAKEPEAIPAGKKSDIISPVPAIKPELKAPAPTKPGTSPNGKKYLTGKGIIKNIRYKSFKGYTQVTIYLSVPVEFTKNRISKPERLYFDLKNTTLSKKVKAILNAGDGILKTVRARQYSKDTVRIVLDVEKVEDFNASIFTKPARLVIDIYASKPGKKGTDIVPPAQIKKPEITPAPLTKKPEVTAPAPTKPELVSPSPPQAPEVTAPALKKEPDAVPLEQKPEASPMPKENAADYISSGEKHIQSGEDEKALLDFRKAVELNPQSAETYVAIGRSLFKLGKKDEALDIYKKAIERDPNSADAYNGLGYAYYLQGKLGSAVDAFLMAIKLNPEHDDAHAGLGYTYLTMGDTNSAIDQYRILKSLDSNKADDLFRLIFKEQQNKEQGKTLEVKPSVLK
ncbi:MAG: AMIN domain-containing protein [Thermodesulfovibrionales bacterium]|nr:AMIN domain-containing protein [Thermodesulfovibrionales bacterium]